MYSELKACILPLLEGNNKLTKTSTDSIKQEHNMSYYVKRAVVYQIVVWYILCYTAGKVQCDMIDYSQPVWAVNVTKF